MRILLYFVGWVGFITSIAAYWYVVLNLPPESPVQFIPIATVMISLFILLSSVIFSSGARRARGRLRIVYLWPTARFPRDGGQ